MVSSFKKSTNSSQTPKIYFYTLHPIPKETSQNPQPQSQKQKETATKSIPQKSTGTNIYAIFSSTFIPPLNILSSALFTSFVVCSASVRVKIYVL